MTLSDGYTLTPYLMIFPSALLSCCTSHCPVFHFWVLPLLPWSALTKLSSETPCSAVLLICHVSWMYIVSWLSPFFLDTPVSCSQVVTHMNSQFYITRQGLDPELPLTCDPVETLATLWSRLAAHWYQFLGKILNILPTAPWAGPVSVTCPILARKSILLSIHVSLLNR